MGHFLFAGRRKAAAAVAALLALSLAAVGYFVASHGGSSKVGSPTSTRMTETASVVRPVSKRPLGVAWPTYGYDFARTHVAPTGFGLHPPFRELWMMRAHYYVEFPPSVAYGKVYIAQLKGVMYAVDARTGRVVWQRAFPSYCTFSSPTIAAGVVYQAFIPAP